MLIRYSGSNSDNEEVDGRHYQSGKVKNVCWDPRDSTARPALSSSIAAAGIAAGTMPRLVARTRKIRPVFLVFLLCMTETAIAFTILFDCSLCPCGGTTMRWLDPLYVSSRANFNIHVERGARAYILFDERARARSRTQEYCVMDALIFHLTELVDVVVVVAEIQICALGGKFGYSKRFLLHWTAYFHSYRVEMDKKEKKKKLAHCL